MRMVNPQLNVGRLPANEIQQIKLDCVRCGVSLEDYALKAFKAFRATPINDRRKLFEGEPKKIMGRKVTI
jgi:hypothetical protein